MASAAAVGADAARSPGRNDIGEDRALPGEIASGVYSKDEGLPDVNGDISDSDEDLPANPLRGHKPTRRANNDDEDNLENNLFGDDEEGPAGEREKSARRLDDEELDSGDDVDRTDRLDDEPEEEEYVTQEKVTMDLELPRQPIPEPSDGEMYLLKMPSFMSIDPRAWDVPAFQPPTTDHHSVKAPSATFSAYNTALTTIRWRRSPSDHSKLQSNARINRWSDGSLTLQLASDPTTQYEIDGNPLAPPQRNPIKPTPVSKQSSTNKGGRAGASAAGMDDKYKQTKDAFTYLVRPHRESGTMIVTHKITAGLSIKSSSSAEDDAIERLQASLAAASGAHKPNGTSGLMMELDERDPEKAKREAIAAQKKIDAERRKQQAAADRENARAGRMGRGGMGHARYSGLNVGMLEDDEEGARPSPHKARGANPRRRRRNSEYSDDEDFGRRNFQNNDEYDRDDDFLAASDEEEVVEDDDDDPDDGIVEEPRDRRERERTPKRDRAAAEEDGEEDAPGEEDEEGVQMARTKRRRIVADEEDEEE